MKLSSTIGLIALGLGGIFLTQVVFTEPSATAPAAKGQAIEAAAPAQAEAGKKDEPVHVKGDKEFAAQVLEAKGAVLVDFYADWCPPCRQLAPVLAEIAKEKAQVLKVVKVDVDQNKALAQRYKVTGIPHLVLFKDGKVSGTQTGFVPKAGLLQWLAPHLN